MTNLTLGQELPLYKLIAKNYATDSANKIHSDKVASQYGFSGGLVPGVGLYAYLAHPVVEALGSAWLERGAMTAKFLKPVYDGESVCVRGKVASLDPVSLTLELINTTGTLCAVGTAHLPESPPLLKADDYPFHPLPPFEQRPPAALASVAAGKLFGSLEIKLSLAEMEATFLEGLCETLPIYRGPGAVCHPAIFPAEANNLLHYNVELGPWIHTASEVQHYSLPRDGETLSLRGWVADSYEKRGHEFVVLDLGMFANHLRPVAHIRHTAIIRLRGTN